MRIRANDHATVRLTELRIVHAKRIQSDMSKQAFVQLRLAFDLHHVVADNDLAKVE
jgi:hypothetical protein